MSTGLIAQGVSLRRGARCVLGGVSLTLAPGQSTALIGTNGAGKSTLLSVLAGLTRPDAGQIQWAGRPLTDWSPKQRAQQIAWLAQGSVTDSAMSVYDLVMLGRLPHQGHWGHARPDDHAAVARALADTDCSKLAERRIDSLSGGERQRALIARALATEAPLLLLDEPTTHLDAPQQRRLRAALAARQRAGTTIAMVVHDLNHALSADQLVLLENGQVRLAGSPHDPAVHAALCAALDHAIRMVAIDDGPTRQWVALPR
jgi:iron complex transport system ATP-binding protein